MSKMIFFELVQYLVQSGGLFLLLRRGKVYYCRVWVPQDLRDRLGCRELKKSLHTSIKREAKAAAGLLEGKATTAFFRLRAGLMTDRELEQLTVSILAEFTGKIEGHRKQRNDGLSFLYAGVPHGISPHHDAELLEATFTFPEMLQPQRQVIKHGFCHSKIKEHLVFMAMI